MHIRTFLPLATSAVLVSLAGCSPHDAGTANPQHSRAAGHSAKPSEATTPHGAPKVEGPIDVQKYLDNPCQTLTKKHWKKLGATEPGRVVTDAEDNELFGISCLWTDSSNNASFGPGFLTSNKNGLDDLYRGNKEPGFWGYFVPTEVRGYPSVYVSGVDLRETGSCGIAVGVTDNLAMLATTQGYSGKDEACSKAKATAAAAIETMKQGA